MLWSQRVRLRMATIAPFSPSIYFAAHQGHRRAVDALLSHGVDIDGGSSRVLRDCQPGKPGVYRYDRPLIAAVTGGNHEVTRSLLPAGAYVNRLACESDYTCDQALVAAVSAGQQASADIIRTLIQYGINVDYSCEVRGTAQARASESRLARVPPLSQRWTKTTCSSRLMRSLS